MYMRLIHISIIALKFYTFIKFCVQKVVLLSWMKASNVSKCFFFQLCKHHYDAVILKDLHEATLEKKI